MAPSLPLCLSNAFCSHRQASCLLLVALMPFFFPLLILSVPFLLLFLAPLCCLLFSLLLLYKVQVSIGLRYPCILRKRAFWTAFEESSSLDVDKEGRSQVLPEFAEELDGANAQSAASSEEADADDSHAVPSNVALFMVEEPNDVEELDGRNESERKQAERDVIEGRTDKREDVLSIGHREHGEDESLQEHGEDESLRVLEPRTTEGPIDLAKEAQYCMMEGMQSDQGKKLMGMQEENVIKANFKEKILTPFPSTEEEASLQATSKQSLSGPHCSRSSILTDEQGNDSGKDQELGAHESVAKFEELPCKDIDDEIFEIDTSHIHVDTQEHDKQYPGVTSERQSGSLTLDFVGKPEKHDLLSSTEKGAQEGQTSGSSMDIGIEHGRAEAVPKELEHDARSQQDMLVSDLEASSQLESSEQDKPFETVASSTQRPSEDVESEDKIQAERRILADIFAIKKIVGYYGEAHASVVEHVTALYRFLGMEPYEWDMEVDELERARAEIELLKLVVGVK